MSANRTTERVRVLVAEDSPTMRELLVNILQADPHLDVIGTAGNGEEAIAAAARQRPDVISMDIHMPKMDGLEATRRIMETVPTPIVIVSASALRNEVAATFRALEAGALAIAEKPPGVGHPEYQAAARELVQTIKSMSEVKVVRRWPRRAAAAIGGAPLAQMIPIEPARAVIKLVAIGASTGGPMALRTIFAGLRKDFPVPILVVQHIAAGFTDGFVEWLTGASGFAVRTARQNELPLPGYAYIAPDALHMRLDASGHIALFCHEPENGHRPSVSCLFRSVANVLGRHAIGVLLSGMGKDGAHGLRQMKERDAVTIAQDEASSIVYGMPGEAVSLDAATYVLSPSEISAVLGRLVQQNQPWPSLKRKEVCRVIAKSTQE